jgi:dipeptidase D
MTNISDLEPKDLWGNFEQLCQIPRPSHHEEKISKFMQEFGEKLGLETKVDQVGNVVIRKPATSGFEDRKTLVLQAHIDMVPQKNSDVTHDFEKDPIQAYIDGDWVTAKGTTLGADNGIGVATMMVVLQSKDIEHGPIEALFTVDEEDGMLGAFELKPDFIKGDILINLDGEDEGELTIGCAGGINTDIEFAYSEEELPQDMVAFKLDIAGLKGGHSGCDINLGRGNAIKIVNRILWNADKKYDLRLASIGDVGLRNAIPREVSVVITILQKEEGEFLKFIDEFSKVIKQELVEADPGLKVTATKTELPKTVIDKKTQDNLINSIYACPNGVIRMSDTIPGLVETSSNLGVVGFKDKKVYLRSLQRSSINSSRDDISDAVLCAFELAGAKVDQNGAYPGWNPNPDSSILKLMEKIYKDKFGKDPDVSAIHAGLECGLLLNLYPNLDACSCGPTIKFPHSPDEKIEIKTVKKFWDYLLEILKEIPKK